MWPGPSRSAEDRSHTKQSRGLRVVQRMSDLHVLLQRDDGAQRIAAYHAGRPAAVYLHVSEQRLPVRVRFAAVSAGGPAARRGPVWRRTVPQSRRQRLTSRSCKGRHSWLTCPTTGRQPRRSPRTVSPAGD